MRLRIAAVLLMPMLVACGRNAGGRGNLGSADTSPSPPYNMDDLPPDSVSPAEPREPLTPRPDTLADSVRIEGTWQPERLTMVRAPGWFVPPFTTYVPAGLRTDFEPTDSTPSVRFVAAFAGHVNPEAYLQVHLYPPGSSELEVRSYVDAFLRERDPQLQHVRPSGGWRWTIAAWDFDYTEGADNTHFMGTVGIARHGNRFMHVLAHYPAEYGDGVGPRFHRILQEWRWEDDGTPLLPPTGRPVR